MRNKLLLHGLSIYRILQVVKEELEILWVAVGIVGGVSGVIAGFLGAYMHDQRMRFKEFAHIVLLMAALLGAGFAFMVATLFGEGRLEDRMDVLPMAGVGALAGIVCSVIAGIGAKALRDRHARVRRTSTRPRPLPHTRPARLR